MPLRKLPKWEQELEDEIRDAVEEKAREEEIDLQFVQDSRQVEDGIRQVIEAVRRIDDKVKTPVEEKVLRDNSDDLEQIREDLEGLEESRGENE
ncbi:MAG: hypothetical protein SVS85_03570 [Candidatus Nanohaloarchaea archaeon]|nr:hypothetical protein [Candidatus Nanohaloarchaea archaeon]